jgi:threonylcarbamoyladenosine tRNA methylthiotransferase MtaB
MTPPHEAPGFHTITLGCKLNQFDSAAIEGELVRRGLRHERRAERASVVIVNTCTVTHRADAEARKLIRSIRRRNPGCRLLVTGCYAELDPRTLAAVGGIDRVFGNRDKGRVATILDELGVPDAVVGRGDRGCDSALEALHFGRRSRAFLKIQDGCRLSCSYCIIPTVRGSSRSVAPAEVEKAARSLLGRAYREIVLTGVNTGDYGRDLEPRWNLARLLRRLLAVCGPSRLRLNSLEPLTVTDEIIDLMASDSCLAPHLQVPLQSGSPTVLRAMRRNYRLRSYLDRLTRLRAAVPQVCLGADVIVGFPGESEEAFRETLDFVAGSPLDYLHVFAWSPRPGTPAAGLPGRVHSAEIRERSARLRELGERKFLRFRRRFEGERLDAVVLGPARGGNATRALTGNFIEVSLPAGSALPRELIRVRVERAEPGETRAVVDGRPL